MHKPEYTATLKDGGLVHIRLVDPCNKDCIAQGFDQLSARSRHLRFFSPINKLSEAQLSYLTKVDNANHAVIAAFEKRGETPRGVGLGRYVRMADEPDMAEFAITVMDEFQGRGVGSLLLDLLIDRARENGIRVLRGYVIPTNTPMIRMLRRCGGRGEKEADGTLRYDLSLSREGK
jgi:RimJ/RimL family protein N-acetyltransferase